MKFFVNHRFVDKIFVSADSNDSLLMSNKIIINIVHLLHIKTILNVLVNISMYTYSERKLSRPV